MAKNIIINAKGNVMRAAVIKDRSLDNLFIDKNESSSLIGNIYVGKVEKVLPSIQAAFVDIGIGKNGFLPKSDWVDERDSALGRNGPAEGRKKSDQNLNPNQEVLVQVAKDEIGTKGVRLVTDISLPGRFLVLMPFGRGKIYLSRKILDEDQVYYLKEQVKPHLQVPSGMDVIIRTAAAGVKARFLKRDLDNLVKTWKHVEKAWKEGSGIRLLHEELDLVRKIVRDWLSEKVESIYVDDKTTYENLRSFIKNHFANPNVKLRHFKEPIDIFDKFGITRQIEKLYHKKVWLKCGGYLIIDKTEALVAIDINTGRNVRGANSDDTILETNLQGAEEIARQLRLRNMGGIVIIDFIDMKNRQHQRETLRMLQNHLEKDKAKTKVFPFTRLGLVQMTRQRVEESWEQHYFENCETCAGTGRVLAIPVICEQLISKIKRYLYLHPGKNLNVRAHSLVVDQIMKTNGFQEIEKKNGIEIGYLKDDTFHPEKYVVVRTDTGKNIIRYDY